MVQEIYPLPSAPPLVYRVGSNPPPPVLVPDWANPASDTYDPLRVLRERPMGVRPAPPPNPPPASAPSRRQTLSTGPR